VFACNAASSNFVPTAANGTTLNIFTTQGVGNHPYTMPTGTTCTGINTSIDANGNPILFSSSYFNTPTIGALDGDNHLWFMPVPCLATAPGACTSTTLYLDVFSLSGTGTSTSFSLLPSSNKGYTGTSSGDSTLLNPTEFGAVGGILIDGSGNIWLMNSQVQTSTTGNGNALVEFIGAAAPSITNKTVAVQNTAIGTRP